MDSSGIWTVGTTALVFVVAGSESLLAEAMTEGGVGGDVEFRARLGGR